MDTTLRTAIPTIDRIGTMATIGPIMGTADIAITATTVTTIITDTKVT